MSQYESFVEFALEQGDAARRLLRTRDFANWHKEDGTEVSQADIAIQESFNQNVRILGRHSVWGQEMSLEVDDPDIIWSVDPIDGSTARGLGVPTHMFGAAAIEAGTRRIVASVICNLTYEDDYWATIDGEQAYNNGSPIFLSERTLGDDLLIGGTGSNKNREGVQSDTFYRLKVQEGRDTNHTQRMRLSGVPTLFKAVQVARGNLDAAAFKGTKWFDIAAGIGIVSAARRQSTNERGIAVDIRGNPHQLLRPTANGAIFASSQGVCDVMVRELAHVQAFA